MHLPASIGFAAALLCAGGTGNTWAAPPGFGPDAAVSAATLAACRGGFETPAGLRVTLGLERIVTLDGSVAAHSRLALGDLGRLASGGGALPASAGFPGAAVIQNSLNNALIRHTTIIDASVDTHGMLQAMHFQSTLANALSTAARAR